MAKEYIERNALIAEYDRVHVGPPGGARKLMVDAPTADVAEVKHGEWIKLDGEWREQSTNKPVTIHQCSCCGMYYQNAPYNFCPSCGAKMDGGKAE